MINFNRATGEITSVNVESVKDDSKLKEIEDYVKDYNALLDEYYEAQDNSDQALRDALDTKLEIVSYALDKNIEISNLSLKLYERELTRLDDKAFALADKLSNTSK